MSQAKGSKCYEIFIVNLSAHIDEPMLFKAFQHFGRIAKIKIQRDLITKESRGIGFIEYCEPKAGFKAINMMSNKKLHGQTIQVYNKSWYKENISDQACVVVQNLATSVTEQSLKQIFRDCGFIFSVKINKGVYDQLNTASVQYLQKSMALDAIAKHNNEDIQGEKVLLRLGCKECQVFLKVKADSLEISNLLKKILGDFYPTCHISQLIQNRHKDKVLVHVHFQNDKNAEEFRKEYEGFARLRESQKHTDNVEEKFLALEDVKGYDERIQISREFQSQQKIFTAFLWPLNDNFSLEKIQSIVEDFIQNPMFTQSKRENQLKFKYLEKIEQKKQEQKEPESESKLQEESTPKAMNDFQEVFCEVNKTRLNRNYLTVKFRNSDCFQEFVRCVYFKQNEVYRRLQEFEIKEEPFQISYDYNTIYNMKNEIHNKLKQKKKPQDLDNQFSQFNLNQDKQQDFFQADNPIAEQKIDLYAKEVSSEEQLAKEQEKLRAKYAKEFQQFTSTEAIENDKENFNYLPKNIKNLIFFDILINKIAQEDLLSENMNMPALKTKVYEILNQSLLGYEELIQMLSEVGHLKSFLQVVWDSI